MSAHDRHVEVTARALYGFVIASAIFTVLVYSLLFQIRGSQIASCERVNTLRVESNERAISIEDILGVLIEARTGSDALARDGAIKANRRETEELIRARDAVDTVPIPDCHEAVPKPWPFG